MIWSSTMFNTDDELFYITADFIDATMRSVGDVFFKIIFFSSFGFEFIRLFFPLMMYGHLTIRNPFYLI